MLNYLKKFTNLFIIGTFSILLGLSFGFGYLAIKLILSSEQVDNDFLMILGVFIIACCFATISILIIWSIVFNYKFMTIAVIFETLDNRFDHKAFLNVNANLVFKLVETVSLIKN
jgi:hypothetical protein